MEYVDNTSDAFDAFDGARSTGLENREWVDDDFDASDAFDGGRSTSSENRE